jgi:hypothetical protein
MDSSALNVWTRSLGVKPRSLGRDGGAIESRFERGVHGRTGDFDQNRPGAEKESRLDTFAWINAHEHRSVERQLRNVARRHLVKLARHQAVGLIVDSEDGFAGDDQPVDLPGDENGIAA